MKMAFERIIALIMVCCFLCTGIVALAVGGDDSSPNSDLAGLKLSCGALSPAFCADTTSYTAEADDTVSTLVYPVAADPSATITVNGTPCASGSNCKVNISKTGCTITIVVTGRDVASKTYTITVTLKSKSSPGLSSLSISSGTLSPAFDTNTLSYSASVDNSVSSLTLTPVALDANQTITIKSTVITSGSQFSLPLSVGINTIVIAVTTQEGNAKSYTITVTRADKTVTSSPGLSSLAISSGTLSPVFDTNTLLYSASVDNSVTKLYISATPCDTAAVVKIDGSTSNSVSLYVGINTVTVTVKSSDDITKIYTITVTRADKDTANSPGLSGLAISSGTLSPAFDTNTLSYSASVDNSVTKLYISAIPCDTDAVVKVDGSTSSSVSLYVGINTVTVTVKSSDGIMEIYTIAVTRADKASVDKPGLSGLAISSGTLSPAFDINTLSYSESVDNDIDSVTLTPTVADTAQSIVINAVAVNNGCGFRLPLSVGANTAVITVKSSDGTAKSYMVTVTRAEKDGTGSRGLSSLVISSGALSPSFAAGTHSYSANVENTVTKLYISAVATDTNSTVKINGSAGSTVSLAVGINTVTITVTAPDKTVTAYIINVFRKYDTRITVTSQNANGDYCADVPDYVSLLDDSDALTFDLGDDTIVMPVASLKAYTGSGILSVSCGEPSQSTVKKASAAISDNRAVAGSADIILSGGSASIGSKINARVTLKLKSGEKTTLKSGVPEIYYYNIEAGSLKKVDAAFDMTAGTASFTAASSGTYIIAAALTNASPKYTVTADSHYKTNGGRRTFNVRITRGNTSIRLSGGRLMVVSAFSNGQQTICFKKVTGDDCEISVSVSKKAVRSTIYLISGNFDGRHMPKTYGLAQFVKV